MKIYFAHSMLTYNTLEEANQRGYLESLGTVICPNRDIYAKGKKDYQAHANTCDMVVCSEFMGFVGRGVASQVQDALILEVPVKLIRWDEVTGKCSLHDVEGLVNVTEERDWKVRYATIVIKQDKPEEKANDETGNTDRQAL